MTMMLPKEERVRRVFKMRLGVSLGGKAFLKKMRATTSGLSGDF
jgi:hypothetical protein